MSSKNQDKILQKKYRMREEIGTREKFDMYFVEVLTVTGGISILEAALGIRLETSFSCRVNIFLI